MANLSNINNYFVVDTTGKVAIGDVSTATIPTLLTQLTLYDNTATASVIIQSGAASGKKYELGSSSTGKFQITDLDASTDRLTISSGGNATFSGSVTAASFNGAASTFDPMVTVTYSDISTGENRGLRIINTSGTDQQWNITTGVTGSENESFCIRDSTANVNVLTMAISSGNAVFSGEISSGDDINCPTKIVIGESAKAELRLKKTATGRAGVFFYMPSNTETSYIELDASEDMVYYGYAGVDQKFYAGTSLNLTLSGTDATFAGKVGIGVSPSAKLQVSGTTKLGGACHFSSDGSFVTSYNYTFRDGVYINNPNSSSAVGTANSVMSIGGSSGNSVITSLVTTGAIGVGNSNPAYKLDVSGNIRSSTVTVYDGMGGTETGIGASSAGGNLRLYSGGVNRVTVTNTARTMEIYGLDTVGSNFVQFFNSAGTAQGYIGMGAGGANDFIIAQESASVPIRIFNGGSERMRIKSNGYVGIGETDPHTKLDVKGATGTRNRNTQGSSVYETSLYFNAAGNATTNVSIDTTTAFPPMGSGGFILVEVSASGYGNSGSNGLIFSYITGGYGGHYAAVNQPYHPVQITVNSMQAGTCTWYNPSANVIGITVATTNSAGLTGLMRVKVTTTY